ncbi:MAG: DUF4404 family protein [Verrucomicrobia bacterium]|nr:DUF4404 family protein [Verrucomicrobiota bacterium]
MIQETIEKLAASIQEHAAVRSENKAELLQLLDQLKSEVGELEKTDAEQARSIAGFAAVSAHEATRARPDAKLLELSLSGLSHSVAEFEETHPRLVQVVNSISNALSNLGI